MAVFGIFNGIFLNLNSKQEPILTITVVHVDAYGLYFLKVVNSVSLFINMKYLSYKHVFKYRKLTVNFKYHKYDN